MKTLSNHRRCAGSRRVQPDLVAIAIVAFGAALLATSSSSSCCWAAPEVAKDGEAAKEAVPAAEDRSLNAHQEQLYALKLHSELAQVQAELREIAGSRSAALDKSAVLTRELSALAADEFSSAAATRRVASPESERLVLLSAQARQLAATLHDNHPRLAALRQRIVDLREDAATPFAATAEGRQGAAAQRRSLEAALAAEREQLDMLQSKERQLNEVRDRLSSQAMALVATANTPARQRTADAAIAPQIDQSPEEPSRDWTSDSIPRGSGVAHSIYFVRRQLLVLLGCLATVFAIAAAAICRPRPTARRINSADQLAGVWDLPLIGVLSNAPAPHTTSA